MLALFGLAARAAVRGAAPGPAAGRVPPARHGVLVINPRSGSGKAGRTGLAAAAARRGIATRGGSPAGAAATLSGRDIERLVRIAVGR
jgi:hypothetical protein